MHHNNKVFTEGDYLPLIGGKNGYTSKRELNNQSVYTLINPKNEDETFVITMNNKVKGLLDMHTGKQIFADRNREVIIKLSPLSGTWLQEIV